MKQFENEKLQIQTASLSSLVYYSFFKPLLIFSSAQPLLHKASVLTLPPFGRVGWVFLLDPLYLYIRKRLAMTVHFLIALSSFLFKNQDFVVLLM